MSTFDRLRMRVLFASLRRRGATIGRNCHIARSAELGPGPYVSDVSGLFLGDRCRLDIGAIVYTYGGEVSLGDGVYLGPYSVIYGHGGVRIGKDTLVAMGCAIVSSNHAIPGREIRISSLPDEMRQTTIGEDCWLGAGVSVLAGVKIENGCVIGAGAVVTKNIPAYSVAMGNPARVVRCRA